MIVRYKSDVDAVEWGNGQSYRLLVERDGMGFAVAHTVVSAGSSSKLKYRRHLEACYCISGKGEVTTAEGETYIIEPGVLYGLNENDAHTLSATPEADMHLISIWNPPIRGDEKHELSPDGYSQY